VIEDAGSKTEYKKGDEVFGLAYGGAYAEYIVLNARMLTRKPEELSFAEAAAIPEAWLTEGRTSSDPRWCFWSWYCC